MVYIYIYCTVLYSKKYFGFSSVSKCIYVYGILAPKSNVNSSYTLNHRGNVFISLPSFAASFASTTSWALCPNGDVAVFLTTVSVMTQQSLALYANGDVAIFFTPVSVMTQQSLALLPFCKHLYQ